MNGLLKQVAAALLAALAGIPLRAEEAPAAPVRVVSQTVGTDEMLLALADPGQIAALSHLARDPDYSAVAVQAGGFPVLQPNGDAESVLKFRPTVVLCSDYSRAELMAQLRRAGVSVVRFDRYTTIDDAYANLRMLAGVLGAEGRAERLIASCQERMVRLGRSLQGVRPARVIAPSVYGVIPGADTTFQDLCDHAGATNLASTLGHLRGHAPPPAEQMLGWPVDQLVLGGTNLQEALAPFLKLSPYEFMDSVKSGRAVLLRPYLLSCVSFHRIDGYEELARALHPEAFP
jgi:iron complex transport system substrate-binding protein